MSLTSDITVQFLVRDESGARFTAVQDGLDLAILDAARSTSMVLDSDGASDVTICWSTTGATSVDFQVTQSEEYAVLHAQDFKTVQDVDTQIESLQAKLSQINFNLKRGRFQRVEDIECKTQRLNLLDSNMVANKISAWGALKLAVVLAIYSYKFHFFVNHAKGARRFIEEKTPFAQSRNMVRNFLVKQKSVDWQQLIRPDARE